MASVPASGQELLSLTGHDPVGYVPHALHRDERAYGETNCYTDVVIELLHACGLEPLAALGSCVRVDFEGDQWTFFKTPPGDLEALYGIDLHEMQPYRPLPEQIAQQLARGRTVIVELDAWHLPDTASTSYRCEHVKTSVAVEAIDLAGQRLRYFHNRGLHELEGEDYRAALRLLPGPAEALPPYVELVRFDAGPQLADPELRTQARELLRGHLQRIPAGNPFERFATALNGELPALLEADLARYHAYAFATVRMAGAAFELTAAHADWLFAPHDHGAADALRRIVDGCKTLSFKLARRRPFDPRPALTEMAEAWTEAIGALRDAAAGAR